MNYEDNGNGRSVAIYWDFENLHAALVEAKYGEGSYTKADVRFKAQDTLVDVQALVELCSSFGTVAINRAYCNWQFFGRYRDALLQGCVELIQLFPPGPTAKNGADIKLCLDAAEDISRFRHIETVVIIGGDSDFMPLAQKIKAAGRTLIGIGNRKNTNRHWAKSCHEFRYYDNLVEESTQDGCASATETLALPIQGAAADILARSIRLLSESSGDIWVHKASVWPMIKRLDPAFSLKDHGASSFSDMLKALDAIVEVRKGEKDHLLRLK
jgi:uncharacterized LabA/DUF88 family protein